MYISISEEYRHTPGGLALALDCGCTAKTPVDPGWNNSAYFAQVLQYKHIQTHTNTSQFSVCVILLTFYKRICTWCQWMRTSLQSQLMRAKKLVQWWHRVENCGPRKIINTSKNRKRLLCKQITKETWGLALQNQKRKEANGSLHRNKPKHQSDTADTTLLKCCINDSSLNTNMDVCKTSSNGWPYLFYFNLLHW